VVRLTPGWQYSPFLDVVSKAVRARTCWLTSDTRAAAALSVVGDFSTEQKCSQSLSPAIDVDVLTLQPEYQGHLASGNLKPSEATELARLGSCGQTTLEQVGKPSPATHLLAARRGAC
jgi:hypothetical protein